MQAFADRVYKTHWPTINKPFSKYYISLANAYLNSPSKKHDGVNAYYSCNGVNERLPIFGLDNLLSLMASY